MGGVVHVSETVQHADNVDYADAVEVAEHIEKAAVVVVPPANRGPVERVMRQAAWLLIALALVGFAVGGLALGHQVGKLTDQLADARTALVTQQADVLAKLNETNAKAACVQSYSAQRQAAFQVEFSAIAQVTVAGFSTAPAPSTDRATAINTALVQLGAAVDNYSKAVAALDGYVAAGSPLPCPLVT